MPYSPETGWTALAQDIPPTWADIGKKTLADFLENMPATRIAKGDVKNPTKEGLAEALRKIPIANVEDTTGQDVAQGFFNPTPVSGLLGAVRPKGRPFSVMPKELYLQTADIMKSPGVVFPNPEYQATLRRAAEDLGPIYDKKLRQYTNKYLGAEDDPLKDLTIPNPIEDELIPWARLTNDLTQEISPEGVHAYIADPEWQRLVQKGPYDLVGPLPLKRQPFVGPMPADYQASVRLPDGHVIHGLEGKTAEELYNWKSEGFPGKKYLYNMLDDYSRFDLSFYENELAKALVHGLENKTPEQIKNADFVRILRDWPNEYRALEDAKLNNTERNFAGTEPFLATGKDLNWVKITDPEALIHEGTLMNHCIGGACDELNTGLIGAYSLRDSMGKSHATVSTRASDPLLPVHAVDEIKGRANSSLKDEYSKALMKLLRKFPEHGIEAEIPKSQLQFARVIPDPEGGYLTMNDAIKNIRDLGKGSPDKVQNLINSLEQEAGNQYGISPRRQVDLLKSVLEGERVVNSALPTLAEVYKKLF